MKCCYDWTRLQSIHQPPHIQATVIFSRDSTGLRPGLPAMFTNPANCLLAGFEFKWFGMRWVPFFVGFDHVDCFNVLRLSVPKRKCYWFKAYTFDDKVNLIECAHNVAQCTTFHTANGMASETQLFAWKHQCDKLIAPAVLSSYRRRQSQTRKTQPIFEQKQPALCGECLCGRARARPKWHDNGVQKVLRADAQVVYIQCRPFI